jgi:nucleoid-associated protein
MSIKHFVAHHLSRDADLDAKASLALRDDELVTDEVKEKLFTSLKKSFRSRLARKHGGFAADEGPSLLAQRLQSYIADEHSFMQLSVELMGEIESAVNERGVELNTHFLFFMENLSEKHQLFYLFVVSQSESLSINDSLDVAPSYSIDTGPSLAAIKVDLADWQEEKKQTYLTLLPPRGNVLLGEIFENMTGFTSEVDKLEATANFLDGVETFAKQLPNDKTNDYRSQVVDYCMQQEEKDEAVSIPGLSKELGGIDCEQFVREMANYSPPGEDEFRIDKRSLKQLVKFSGRDKDLAISFSTFHLHSRVNYDVESDTLSIRGLPTALRKQLLKHFEQE